MRGYSITGANISGTGPNTIMEVVGSATIRPAIYEIDVGNAQAPADQAWRLTLMRRTAAGTGLTAVTPRAVDQSDVAAICTANEGTGATIEPTYTAASELLNLGMNQRGPYRWVAFPGYEFKGPATATNGLGARLQSATAAMIIQGTMMFFE